jgi:hypothetical protein
MLPTFSALFVTQSKKPLMFFSIYAWLDVGSTGMKCVNSISDPDPDPRGQK